MVGGRLICKCRAVGGNPGGRRRWIVTDLVPCVPGITGSAVHGGGRQSGWGFRRIVFHDHVLAETAGSQGDGVKIGSSRASENQAQGDGGDSAFHKLGFECSYYHTFVVRLQ